MKIDESKTIVNNYLKNNRNTMDNITIKAFNHLFDFYGIQITTKPNRNTNKINYPENIIAAENIFFIIIHFLCFNFYEHRGENITAAEIARGTRKALQHQNIHSKWVKT